VKTRKQSSLVHLKPAKLDPAGGALFISHKRRIVGDRRACKGGNTKFIGLMLFNNFVIGNDTKTLETNLARIKPEYPLQ
jgi:hypothetical protein